MNANAVNTEVYALQITAKPEKVAGFVKFLRTFMPMSLQQAAAFINGEPLTVTESQLDVIIAVVNLQNGSVQFSSF